jgi:hypothetical protein
MNPEDQKVKVKTDYKMSRHFNGIVLSVLGAMLVIVVIYATLFTKGCNKKMAPTAAPTSPASSAPKSQ